MQIISGKSRQEIELLHHNIMKIQLLWINLLLLQFYMLCSFYFFWTADRFSCWLCHIVAIADTISIVNSKKRFFLPWKHSLIWLQYASAKVYSLLCRFIDHNHSFSKW